MAAYFQLISKKTGEPTPFNQIDKELCDLFEQPVDPEKYILGWYDAIGWRIATGRTAEQIWDEFQGYVDANDHANYYSALLIALNYILDNYTSSAWYSRG